MYLFKQNTHMDDFDDLSIENFSTFDFVEELFEEEEEEDNKKSFDTYLNSKTDYWLKNYDF